MRARKIKRTVVFLPQPQMRLAISVAACCLSLMLAVQAAEARILRVGAYNTFNNPDNATEDAWFSTIFKAIGNEVINGTAKRLDVLAVSETDTGSSARLASVLNSLYSVSSYSAVTSSSVGGDRTGLVYDASTVTLLGSADLTGNRDASHGPRPVSPRGHQRQLRLLCLCSPPEIRFIWF